MQLEKAEEPIAVRESGTPTVVSEVQPLKTVDPSVVKESGSVIVSKELQFWKAPLLSDVSTDPSGKMTSVKEVQPLKAPMPIDVSFGESVTDSSDVQPLKVFCDSSVTVGGSVIDLSEVQFWNVALTTRVRTEPSAKSTVSSAEQFPNAEVSRICMEAGIETAVSDVQP